MRCLICNFFLLIYGKYIECAGPQKDLWDYLKEVDAVIAKGHCQKSVRDDVANLWFTLPKGEVQWTTGKYSK